MSDTLASHLRAERAGTFTGTPIFMEGYRKPGSARGDRRGASIIFQTSDMSKAMMLYDTMPDGPLLHTIASPKTIQDNIASYRKFPAMGTSEVKSIIDKWFDGNEQHIHFRENYRMKVVIRHGRMNVQVGPLELLESTEGFIE